MGALLSDSETRAVALVQACLDPILLHPNYQKNWSPENPTYGFCSVASEALYFLLGGSLAGWKAVVGRDESGTHWWLESETGRRLDPTADQYLSQGKRPPYDQGRPGGFMGMREEPGSPWGFGRRPSRRAKDLLDRVLASVGVDPRDDAAIRSWVHSRSFARQVPRRSRPR